MEKKKQNNSLFVKIREAVCQIPRGKVATYGQIALIVGTSDARKVGWAIYGNKDPKIPRHRVVFADGSLALNYSLGGYKEQKSRLQAEGVKFEEEMKVSLSKYLRPYPYSSKASSGSIGSERSPLARNLTGSKPLPL